MSGNLDMNSAPSVYHSIVGLADPVGARDATNKQYVDAIAEGLHVHAPARLLADFDLDGTYDNGVDGVGAYLDLSLSPIAEIDGVSSFSVGDRIIATFQNNSALDPENGIYYIKESADIDGNGDIIKLTRAIDFDTPAEMAGGDFVFVQKGTQYGNTGWVMTETVSVVGTTPVQFIQFSGAGSFSAGDALSLIGTELNVLYDDSSIGINGSNELEVKSLGISNGMLQDDSVTLSKIANDAVDEGNIVSTALGEGLTGGSGTVLSVDWSTTFDDSKAVKASDLSSIAAGKGASIIGVEDLAGYFAGSNVEEVLAELYVGSDNKKVKVSIDDDTDGYLEEKIVGATNKITVSVLNDALNESLQISIGSDVFDKSVDDTDNIDEGVVNLFFTEARATGSILSGFVSAAGIVSSADSIEVAIEKLDGNLAAEIEDRIEADDAITDRLDLLEAASQHHKESVTLVAGDITNGYVDLGFEVIDNSIIAFVGRLAIHLTEDFVTEVVGGVTRIKWDSTSVPSGSLHSAGDEALEAGDKLFFTYIKKLV
jgi:hypothetical protein